MSKVSKLVLFSSVLSHHTAAVVLSILVGMLTLLVASFLFDVLYTTIKSVVPVQVQGNEQLFALFVYVLLLFWIQGYIKGLGGAIKRIINSPKIVPSTIPAPSMSRRRSERL